MPSILTIIRQRRHRRDQSRRSASRRSQRAVLGFGFAAGAVMVVAILALALTYASVTRLLPSLDELPALLDPLNGPLLQPTRFYDRTGQHLIATLSPTDGPRTYIPYDQFPKSLVDATVALVQPDFWNSPGYTLAGWREAESHPTLAQELVYNLLLWDRSSTSLRAIQERILAGQLTARYGREKVLEWYLNSADYGHYAYGAEAAAQYYFGKPVAQLTLSESASLAAIGQAPALNPVDAPQAAESRWLDSLRTMMGQGLITPAEVAQAVANPPSPPAPLPLAGEGGGGEGDPAPAFINLALSQLAEAIGAERVERGGLIITTSLDYDLQLQAVCAVQNFLARAKGSASVLDAADGSACEAARLLPSLPSGTSLPGASASTLILDPTTGQVLALVGDVSSGQQAASLAAHPAGTTITPFIYLTGFSRGLNPASLGWDIPGNTPALGQVYHGPVRLRVALVNDYLPPGERVLEQMGADSVRAISVPFGLSFPPEARLLEDDFSLSPLELASAYGLFANNGTLAGQPVSGPGLEPTAVLQVTGVDHSIWLDWTTPREQSVVSLQLAYLMNHVLSDETARWPSLGHPSPLEIGRPAGAKVSRALDLSSAWTVGYTPQRVVAIWLGRAGAGNASVPPSLSADLWHGLMQYTVRDLPVLTWDAPSGILSLSVCDPSGMLPTAACPNVVSEVFLDGRQPVQADTLYRTFQINIETGLLATVFTPPEQVEERVYMVVPQEARAWAESAGIAQPPTQYDTVQVPPVLPDVHISSPGMFTYERGGIEIRGSAAGADFSSYRLEYGQGLYPTSWVLIGSDSTTPVTEGSLGDWDTSGLNGLYALRLMVVRGDRRVDQAVLQLTLDNTPPQVAISYPQPGQQINLADEPRVALQAQVNDPFLSEVAFYLDGKLLGKFTAAPFGAVWDARVGDHTLRVVATDQSGNQSEASIAFSVKR